MRKAEMTKKTSTPTNPPPTPGTPTWNRTTASTATARRPSMSGRNPFPGGTTRRTPAKLARRDPPARSRLFRRRSDAATVTGGILSRDPAGQLHLWVGALRRQQGSHPRQVGGHQPGPERHVVTARPQAARRRPGGLGNEF